MAPRDPEEVQNNENSDDQTATNEQECEPAPKAPSEPASLPADIPGLMSLRSSVRRVRPWEQSTGPRTAKGKARSSMNARKQGERSADAIAISRQLAALLRALREADHVSLGSQLGVEGSRRSIRGSQPVSDAWFRHNEP